jgi:hypothetical protein
VRRAARCDDNQPEIVAEFRGLGASVAHTHMVGDGFADVVVGFRGINVLVEIKDSKKPPSARKLTPAEAKFHDEWRGAIVIIDHPGQCAALLEDMGNKVYPIERKPTMGRPPNDK